MKKLLYRFFLVLALSMGAVNVYSASCVAKNAYFKIVKLSTPSIVIGGKTLKVGDKFCAGEEIKWTSDNQTFLAKNLKNARLVRASKRLFNKKGRIKSIYDLFIQYNKESTRGIFDTIPIEKSTNGGYFLEKRLALVVGNQNYHYIPTLNNSQKDAEDVASTLLDLGFDVIEMYETDSLEIVKGVDKFSELAKDYNVALFYYAGHGIQENFISYLVPVDKNFEEEKNVKGCVNCFDIIKKVEDSNCESRIFYFDACRENLTAPNDAFESSYLSEMVKSLGTVVVYATQSGNVAFDGVNESEGNSPFAKVLMKNMRNPNYSFPDMMSALVNETYQLTDSHQRPIRCGDLCSNFRFNPSVESLVTSSMEVVDSLDFNDTKNYRTNIFQLARKYEEEGKFKEALTTYMKEDDNPWCQTNIGLLYINGQGVAKDYKKAYEWIKKAADQEEAYSMFLLGQLYEFGLFVKKDYKIAFKWYEKSAEKGDVNASFKIGCCYDDGIAVSPDVDVAMEWYNIAADKGHTGAMNAIGTLYHLGKNISPDYQKAMEWYRKAADGGNSKAMFNIALLYENGLGVNRDNDRAMQWYLNSAEKGFTQAKIQIANKYYYGLGLNADFNKSIDWFRTAAMENNAGAMRSLGIMYFYGDENGSQVDKKKAKEWLKNASEAGDEKATKLLKELF